MLLLINNSTRSNSNIWKIMTIYRNIIIIICWEIHIGEITHFILSDTPFTFGGEEETYPVLLTAILDGLTSAHDREKMMNCQEYGLAFFWSEEKAAIQRETHKRYNIHQSTKRCIIMWFYWCILVSSMLNCDHNDEKYKALFMHSMSHVLSVYMKRIKRGMLSWFTVLLCLYYIKYIQVVIPVALCCFQVSSIYVIQRSCFSGSLYLFIFKV